MIQDKIMKQGEKDFFNCFSYNKTEFKGGTKNENK